MSASEKNRQALLALLGSDALVAKLSHTRLAVALPEAGTSVSAILLTEVLADTLGRLWPNIDFFGEAAELALRISQDAATSGHAPAEGHRIAWAPPYDLVVCVGRTAPSASTNVIQVGADDWRVSFGAEAECGNGDNPIGPAFAAALTAAQVFLACFASELDGSGARTVDDWRFDVRDLFGAPDLQLQDLDLQETHVFGVGAVTHGFAWLLERWPRDVAGTINLVDSDTYGAGNGQRYAFMKPSSDATSKVDAVAARLRKHPRLVVAPFLADMNSYCQQRGYDRPLKRVVAGLDSEEARRQAGLKSPIRTINMWTGGSYIGAGQYISGDDRACLTCAYPEPTASPRDEVAKFHLLTGLLPELVRELLDSARGLKAEEAQKVEIAKGIAAASIIGEPLRSVLPVLCATGRITVNDFNEAVDVPFAFSSLLAGISGFMMLLRDVQLGNNVSECWTQHVFKRPSQAMMKRERRQMSCVRCNAAELLDSLR
jgi:hypothetical protein